MKGKKPNVKKTQYAGKYLSFGKPITGHEYQKTRPAPRQLLPVIPALKTPPGNDPDIAVRKNIFYGWKQYRPLALRPPNMNIFAFKESELAKDLVENFKVIIYLIQPRGLKAIGGNAMEIPTFPRMIWGGCYLN